MENREELKQYFDKLRKESGLSETPENRELTDEEIKEIKQKHLLEMRKLKKKAGYPENIVLDDSIEIRIKRFENDNQ
jgi:hypothetical protein